MFCIFMIYILIHSIKNYRKYPNVDNYFILVTTIIYIGIELFENVFTFFGKPINIMFLCIVGFSFRSMERCAGECEAQTVTGELDHEV